MRDYRIECAMVTNVFDDITPDVVGGVSWRKGIFDHGPRALVAGPGSMNFELLNMARNASGRPSWLSSSQGRYSPGHANVWTDASPSADTDGVFKHGRVVRLRVGADYHYQQLVIAHGAQVYYRLDEVNGTTANDDAGRTLVLNGTYTGTFTSRRADGPFPDATLGVTLDGSTNYIASTATQDNLGAAGRWAMEIWFKTSTTGANQPLINRDNAGTSRPQLRVSTGNKLQLVSNDGSTTTTVTGDTTVTDGEWHLAHATFDGRNLRVYLDGALDATAVAANNFDDGTSAVFEIGVHNAADFFTGSLKDVALYNHCLSASQIQEKYEARTSPYNVGYADMVILNNPVAYYRLGDVATANYALQSEDLSTTWTTTNASVSTNVSAVPGRISATADRILEDTTNGLHHATQTGLSTDLPSTGSVYLRVKARSYPDGENARNVRLYLQQNGSNFGSALFNLATGAVISEADNGNISIVDSSITSLGDGWYACYIEIDQTSAAIDEARILLLNGSTATYAGDDGTSGIEVGEVHVWHPLYSDTYVATTTAVVENDQAVEEIASEDGTYSGGVTYGVSGALSDGDTAVTFDGTDGLVTTPIDETDVPNTAWSLAAWVKTTSATFQNVISRGNSRPVVYVTSSGFGQVQNNDGSTTKSVTGTTDVADGAWHFLVATYDGTTLTLYVDATSEGTPVAANGYDDAVNNVFLVGGANSGSFDFNGEIDEPAFFDYALTATQISTMYAARTSTLIQDAGKVWYPFLGTLDMIEPEPGTTGPQRVRCSAVDWMGQLADSQPALDIFFEDPTQDPPESFAHHTGELFADLKDDVDNTTPFGTFTFGTQDNVIMIAFDDLGGRRARGTEIAQKICETDLSLFYDRGDGRAGQTVEVLSPSSRSSAASSPDATFAESELRAEGGIEVPSARGRSINDVTVRINPQRIDSANVIATVNRPIPVKQGVGRTIWVDHKDPNNTLLIAGAKGVITPASTTDFTGNSQSDGGGTDRTSEVSVTATAEAVRTKLEWSVTGMNNVWVRGPSGGSEGPQLRGEAIVRDGVIEFNDPRADSIAEFGRKDVVIEASYNFFPEYAEAMAESIADTYEDLTNVPTVVRPNTGVHSVFRKALNVDIGSGIVVSEALTGVDAQAVIVYGVEGEIFDNVYRVSWTVEPALDTTAIDNVDFGTS